MGIESGVRERGEGLWAAYLAFWQARPMVWQGVSVGVGGWDTAMNEKRELRRGWPVESTGDLDRCCFKQVFCRGDFGKMIK